MDSPPVPGRQRVPAVPELFLGLLAIGGAVVLTAHIAMSGINDARRTKDTISVTGSARKPITSNLARWSLTVTVEAPTAAPAARRLRRDVDRVLEFLQSAKVPRTAISAAVVYSEAVVERLPRRRIRRYHRVSQRLNVRTAQIGVVERVSTRLAELIGEDIAVSAEPIQYISTILGDTKLGVLRAATDDARRRAEILVQGLGGKLGGMRSSSLGVYQITPRDSTDVSDYGINDTSTREKDVTAVVTATFAVKR